MSETHKSSCFPCGWKRNRKKDGTKADAADRSKSARQPQESNVEKLKTAKTNEPSITFKDTLAPSDRVIQAKDADSPNHAEYPINATTEATAVQGSSVLELEAAMTSKQPIAALASGLSDEAKPAMDKDVPTDTEYAMEATKKALTVLKGIADIVKFPLVKEVIGLGISILDTCQSISDVQSGVQRLRDRITCLLLSVADSTKDAEESDRLVRDLENLKECLATIMRRLKSIASQNAFKTSLLSEPNMKMISDCEKDFQDSVERFQILRSLEMGQNIVLIQRQLTTFYGISVDMADSVEHIKHEVKDIKSILIGMKSSKAPNTSAYIPQLASPLYGRDEVVQRIVEQLSGSDGGRVCILGPGGMGKTSTALAVMNHSQAKATFGDGRYWVPCIQANSIDNFIAILFKHVKAEKRTGDPLDDIMATLRETDSRRIILLDNFETPWRGIPDGENAIKPILAALDSIPSISILMTMRSEWAPIDTWHCEYLQPIGSEDSRSLYVSIHPDAHKYPDQLKELLDALGHMPYAITLMAARGKRSGTNPEKLLVEWRAQGTNMLSRRAEGVNRCIALSVESDYVRESEDTMRILQVLSMLPAGVNQKDLHIWAGEWSSQAIETLRDTALIITRPVSVGDYTTDHHFVIPVVQSYMAQRDRIPLEVRKAVLEACYRFLNENNATVKGPNDPLFKQHLTSIASQEANLQALLTDVLNDQLPKSPALSPSNHLDAFLAYIYYQRWARPRISIAEQVVLLAQKADAPRQEAAAHYCLGNILKHMVKYEDALQAFESAYAAFDRVGDDLMALLSQLTHIEVDTWRDAPSSTVWKSFEVVQSRWGTTASVDPTFDAHISYYYGYLSCTTNLVSQEEAIPIYAASAERFDRVGLLYEKGYCFHDMAISYESMQDYSSALQHVDVAIAIRYALFGEGFKTPGIAGNLWMRVRFLKGMGCWDDELETTLAAALEASRELGLSRDLLCLLVELGEVYVRKGELLLARETYEEAIRKGNDREDYVSRQAVAEARHNLKHIDYLCTKAQESEAARFVPFQPPPR